MARRGGYDADVIVVGGGPAGSTLGAYLARHGYDAIVLERDVHPREHVGESLVTAANPVLEEIGIFDRMDEFGFIRKPGATWTSHLSAVGQQAKIVFADAPQPGLNQTYTYHVDRGRFDALLLRHAAEQGARVVEGANALRVAFDGDRATGVEVRVLDRVLNLTAPFVVDASGRRALLGKQLGIMRRDPLFDQFAVYSWFSGVRSSEDTRDFIHIHLLPVERGWVWQIPISREVTSVGVVVEKEQFARAGVGHEAFFNDLVALSPNAAHAMRDATRLRDFRIEGDYSYLMDRFSGPGWLLIGDACRFVDPIFSSGVSVAMHSARFAFQAIEAAFAGGDDSGPLEAYAAKVGDGVRIWYEWIKIYYKCQGLFLLLSRDRDARLQMQTLLQGSVFDREAATILDRMKQLVRDVERSENHILKPHLSQSISID